MIVFNFFLNVYSHKITICCFSIEYLLRCEIFFFICNHLSTQWYILLHEESFSVYLYIRFIIVIHVMSSQHEMYTFCVAAVHAPHYRFPSFFLHYKDTWYGSPTPSYFLILNIEGENHVTFNLSIKQQINKKKLLQML